MNALQFSLCPINRHVRTSYRNNSFLFVFSLLNCLILLFSSVVLCKFVNYFDFLSEITCLAVLSWLSLQKTCKAYRNVFSRVTNTGLGISKFQYAKSKAEARDQKWKYKNFQEYLSNNSDNICKEHFAESCVSFYKMAVYCIFK